MKREVLLSACAIAALAAGANAAIIFETESNDTIATANDVGSIDDPGGAIVVDGALVPGDVDWFCFDLLDMTTLFISTLGATGDPLANDGQLQLVDSTGTDVLAFDDDDFVGFLPGLMLEDLPAGTYYLGVSGFADESSSSVDDDTLFDGLEDTGAPHDQEFEYKLTISANLVPTPGAMALAGIGGALMTRRRRA